MLDTAVVNGLVFVEGSFRKADVGIKDGKIAMVAEPGCLPEAKKTIDASGKHVMPGGVDTQRMVNGHLTLSARYMLEGTDADGNACRVFTENTGATDDPAPPMTTTPVIFTDSPALQWLETAVLRGTLEPHGSDGVIIHIFAA